MRISDLLTLQIRNVVDENGNIRDRITLRYIGITQDDLDGVYLNLNL